jgi:hypothetical protein
MFSTIKNALAAGALLFSSCNSPDYPSDDIEDRFARTAFQFVDDPADRLVKSHHEVIAALVELDNQVSRGVCAVAFSPEDTLPSPEAETLVLDCPSGKFTLHRWEALYGSGRGNFWVDRVRRRSISSDQNSPFAFHTESTGNLFAYDYITLTTRCELRALGMICWDTNTSSDGFDYDQIDELTRQFRAQFDATWDRAIR